jgi:hypothetical protein
VNYGCKKDDQSLPELAGISFDDVSQNANWANWSGFNQIAKIISVECARMFFFANCDLMNFINEYT